MPFSPPSHLTTTKPPQYRMRAMDAKSHWEKVYATKRPETVSWYRPHLETSLALIDRAVSTHAAPIIDVGGGASTLVDDLLGRGYENVTVLDVSRAAIEAARQRLGADAARVRWLVADVLETELEPNAYEIWHDRAVFHFLTRAEDRSAYVRQVAHALKPGGHVIISTFGPAGPTKCSGLDVTRYDEQALQKEFGKRFQLIEGSRELHHTPAGITQEFLYCRFRRS
jgi:2-polyprenyl-3-methyl-5-hydroxy-6-metoxy-1,4-benzoquinol methylase